MGREELLEREGGKNELRHDALVASVFSVAPHHRPPPLNYAGEAVQHPTTLLVKGLAV
jgi:hypothetical protein